uniref:Uncharacterized protein n=1 Tax=Ecklonia arborea TaxID=1849970 RepID=A0A8F0FAE3_9PHAE|nr:hypothetical protein [Ecklonia arborea]
MLNKNKKIRQFFFLIKDLDPIFFEFLIDNIEYPNKKLTFTKDERLKVSDINMLLFFIYCNIFSTEQLNLQFQNKTNVNNAKDNLLYYLNREKRRLRAKALNKELKQDLQKSFFLSINKTKNNERVVSSSKNLTSIERLQDFNLV